MGAVPRLVRHSPPMGGPVEVSTLMDGAHKPEVVLNLLLFGLQGVHPSVGGPRERPTLKRGTERKGRQVVDCGRDLWDTLGIHEHI